LLLLFITASKFPTFSYISASPCKYQLLNIHINDSNINKSCIASHCSFVCNDVSDLKFITDINEDLNTQKLSFIKLY